MVRAKATRRKFIMEQRQREILFVIANPTIPSFPQPIVLPSLFTHTTHNALVVCSGSPRRITIDIAKALSLSHHKLIM
jgi:malic enzyme